MKLTTYLKRLLRTRKKIKKVNAHLDEYIRISVHKSRKHLYLQFLYFSNYENLNCSNGKVLLSCSTLEDGFDRNKNNANIANAKKLAEIAISRIKGDVNTDYKNYRYVFDKGAYPYHGIIKELGESLKSNMNAIGIDF